MHSFRAAIISAVTAVTLAVGVLSGVAQAQQRALPARARPPARTASRTKPQGPSTARPGAKPRFSSIAVVRGAPAGARTTPAAGPRTEQGTITFSEFPVGTFITSQYQPNGIIFGGDSPFIATDGANPTSPVLSGTPQFFGTVTGTFVLPNGRPRTVGNFSLDVGYIDTPGSTEVIAYNGAGKAIETEPIEGTGIVHVSITMAGIASFAVESVDPSNPDPAGWDVDNVAFEGYSFITGPPGSGEQGGAPNESENPTTCADQEPVNCATGDYYYQHADFSVPGRGLPLNFMRTYDESRAGTNGPFGFGWTDSYNMSLTAGGTITQEDGSTISFVPNGTGGFTAPQRVLGTLVRNRDGSYTFTRNAGQQQFNFSAKGKLISEADLNGYRTTLGYSRGRLTSVTDQAGRKLTFGYSGSHITTATDPMGRRWHYRYDTGGNLIAATDPAGRTWRFGYDARHRLVTATDPRGGSTKNAYNRAGQVTSQVNPDGGRTTWRYAGTPATPAGGTTTMTDPDGHVTKYAYTNLELGSVTAAAGTKYAATTTYTYDPATLGVTSATDPRGDVTIKTYDASGNVLSATDALGNTTFYGYNNLNENTSKTSPDGESTFFGYDGSGNLLTATDPLGNVTTYAYTDARHPGDLTSVIKPGGEIVRYSYDAAGDLASVRVSPSAGVTQTTRYAYNADGERTCTATPGAGAACPAAGKPWRHGTTVVGYNADGETASVTDPDGHITKYAYDGDGNQALVTNPAGRTTRYGYNGNDQRTSTTLPGKITLKSRFDADGNLIEQVNGAGKATRYSYDPLNQVIATIDPLGRITTYSYDAAGNRLTLTNPSHQTASYTYDADNRLAGVSYSDGTTPGVSYFYDGDGQRTAMTDGTGTTSYGYDADGRLSQVTSGAGATVSYGYDPDGQLTSLTYPNGDAVTRTYDGAGRLTSVKDWLGETTSFRYDANGNLIRQAYPNGIVTTTSFDAASAPIAITFKRGAATLGTLRYARDKMSQVSAASGSLGAQRYGYTQLDQLASDGAGGYRYDAAGDLIQLPHGVRQAYNAAGELTKRTKPAGPARTTGYGYDKQGDRTTVAAAGRATITLRYDEAGRLTGYGAATYAYSGDGLRMAKTVNGLTTGFAWDQSGSTPLVIEAGPVYYVYGPAGQPVEQISGTAPTFLLADQQGSVRLLTNAAGAVTGTYGYSSFGAAAAHKGASTALGFDGQYTDAESGLIYLLNRYYDPGTGQFLTVDPMVAQTGEAYGFAGGNPVNAYDPTGLSWYNPLSWSSGTWAAIGLGVAAVGIGVATLGVGDVVLGGVGVSYLSVTSIAAEGFTYTEVTAFSAEALFTVDDVVGAADTVTTVAGLARSAYETYSACAGAGGAECGLNAEGLLMDTLNQLLIKEADLPPGVLEDIAGGAADALSLGYDYFKDWLLRKLGAGPEC